MNKKLAVLSLSLTSVLAAPFAAFAGQYDVLHKWTDSATGKTYIYVPGQTAGQAVPDFSAPKAPKLRVLTPNNCGWASLTKSSTAPFIDIAGQGGATVNWSTRTSGASVVCTASTANGTTIYSSSNNGAVGTVVDDGSKIWIKIAAGAGSSVTISSVQSGLVTTKANACGFVRVTTTAARPMTGFNVGATSYSLSSVPSVTNPMICRKSGTQSFTYVPAQ